MNASAIAQLVPVIGVIETAGLPALRVIFTIAVIGLLLVGRYIYRRRHLFFDRDRQVDNDFFNVREVRMENILIVWSALTIVICGICIAVWRA